MSRGQPDLQQPLAGLRRRPRTADVRNAGSRLPIAGRPLRKLQKWESLCGGWESSAGELARPRRCVWAPVSGQAKIWLTCNCWPIGFIVPAAHRLWHCTVIITKPTNIVKRKKRGRPPTMEDGGHVGLRLPDRLFKNVDRWAKRPFLVRGDARTGRSGVEELRRAGKCFLISGLVWRPLCAGWRSSPMPSGAIENRAGGKPFAASGRRILQRYAQDAKRPSSLARRQCRPEVHCSL